MGSTRSKVHPKYKARYRVINWPAYNRALRRRGEITIWFSPSVVNTWKPLSSGRRGGQKKYSDAVIELALALRLLFKLPLRQTQGFLSSLLELMDLDLDVPDYSTVSRRTRGLDIALDPASLNGPLELALDATGLAIFGEGEWAATKWGGRGRRGWRKLHIAVDAHGQIQAADLTDSTTSDAATVPGLLEQVDVPVSEVIADGAYDQRPVYQAIHDKGARSVIPPSRRAKISGEPDHRERDAHLERIEKVGRRQWQKEAGYHRQAWAENTFYRLKATFGSRLRARHPEVQRAEALTLCKLLNRMMELGRPTSVRTAA